MIVPIIGENSPLSFKRRFCQSRFIGESHAEEPELRIAGKALEEACAELRATGGDDARG